MDRSSFRRPLIVTWYRRQLDEQQPARFARRVAKLYTQGTLERLCEHDSAEIRRAAALALGFLGDYGANHALGRALQDEDRIVRSIAEDAIRRVWTRAGDEAQQRQLVAIMRLNSAERYAEAARRATRLLNEANWLAEAWNQRAIASFAQGHYNDSIEDCHQALEINPYHFGAAAGMGQAYLEIGNPRLALDSFRRALRLNPNLEAVRVQVARLTRLMEDRGK